MGSSAALSRKDREARPVRGRQFLYLCKADKAAARGRQQVRLPSTGAHDQRAGAEQLIQGRQCACGIDSRAHACAGDVRGFSRCNEFEARKSRGDRCAGVGGGHSLGPDDQGNVPEEPPEGVRGPRCPGHRDVERRERGQSSALPPFDPIWSVNGSNTRPLHDQIEQVHRHKRGKG